MACKPDNHAYLERRKLSLGGWKCNRCGNINESYIDKCKCGMSKDDNELSNGGWKCNKCGNVNPNYTGTCNCGNTKEKNNDIKINTPKRGGWKCRECGRFNSQETDMCTCGMTKEENERQMLSNGGWKCAKCGNINPGYMKTCTCGMTKDKSEEIRELKLVKSEAGNIKQQSISNESIDLEMQNLQKLKSYKELLDMGAITQEEFDKKKTELLK